MKNGVIDKRILNEDPFTNYGSILQLFDGQMNIIQIIIAIIDLINGNGCYMQQENQQNKTQKISRIKHKISRIKHRVLLISLKIYGNMQLYGSDSTKVCLTNCKQ